MMNRLLASMLALLAALTLTITGAAAQEPRSVLFIGNSFTQGSNSAVLQYRPDSVTDLNDDGVGGIPALFAMFAKQMGEEWTVSHELRGGAALEFHLNEKRALIERPWDVVVMQQYSTLNPEQPGNPATTIRDAGLLGTMFERANGDADVYLLATWTRADQAYLESGHWYGKPVTAMADELHSKLEAVDTADDNIDGVIPVGKAWNRAMIAGVADANPYDGRNYGQIDLWSYDHYHASAEGSYLEALVIFGSITGQDVRKLGASERAAHELGIDPKVTAALQQVAAKELGFD